jgi:hypothetical protein
MPSRGSARKLAPERPGRPRRGPPTGSARPTGVVLLVSCAQAQSPRSGGAGAVCRGRRESEYRSRVIGVFSENVGDPGSDSTIRCSARRAHAAHAWPRDGHARARAYAEAFWRPEPIQRCSVSGATSAPLGQLIVPSSRSSSTRAKYAGSRSGSKTPLQSQRDESSLPLRRRRTQGADDARRRPRPRRSGADEPPSPCSSCYGSGSMRTSGALSRARAQFSRSSSRCSSHLPESDAELARERVPR